jgi:hypothetical protein
MSESHKIKITDLRKLRIKRIRYDKVYFDYDGKHYLLVDDTDEDAHLSLYERELSNSKVRLTFLIGDIICGGTDQFIKDISKRRATHTVYSNIDREYFVKKLTVAGLVSGMYSEVYEDYKAEMDKLAEQIMALQNKTYEMQLHFYNTSKHGSKCYGDEVKPKRIKEDTL